MYSNKTSVITLIQRFIIFILKACVSHLVPCQQHTHLVIGKCYGYSHLVSRQQQFHIALFFYCHIIDFLISVFNMQSSH